MIRFGTDGLRGRVNRDITPEIAMSLGNALVRTLAPLDGGPRIAVARDTRPSGPMLEAACIAGICAAGGEAVRLGVLPTSGVSALVVRHGFDGGIMVTASHNPASDNGLKSVDSTGRKIVGDTLLRLESMLGGPLLHADSPGGVRSLPEAGDDYVRAVLDAVPRGRWLAGSTLVLDTANGACVGLAARVLSALGARVLSIGDGTGDRINDGCGALHPAWMAAAVRAHGASCGIALDGDGDRVTLADASGRILDGDAILWLGASGEVVVGTVMTNGGLEASLAERGIRLLRTAVGDSNVAIEMRATGATVGGEPSGHVLFSDGLPTADGLLAGLRALYPGPETLAKRLDRLHLYPQEQAAVRAAPDRIRRCEAASSTLRAAGARVIVRASGTEPVVRVLVEHRDRATAREGLSRLVGLLEQV